MDDDDQPPSDVIDLAAFRARVVKGGGERGRVTARVTDTQLQLFVHGRWVAFGESGARWLQSWCKNFLLRQRYKQKANEHRCGTCWLVKHIECRGHRSSERRAHYRLAATSTGRGHQRQADGTYAEIAYVSRALAACGRDTTMSTEKWEHVTCTNCLKHRPRAVE